MELLRLTCLQSAVEGRGWRRSGARPACCWVECPASAAGLPWTMLPRRRCTGPGLQAGPLSETGVAWTPSWRLGDRLALTVDALGWELGCSLLCGDFFVLFFYALGWDLGCTTESSLQRLFVSFSLLRARLRIGMQSSLQRLFVLFCSLFYALGWELGCSLLCSDRTAYFGLFENRPFRAGHLASWTVVR